MESSSWPGIKSSILALEARSLSHWTTRKVSGKFIVILRSHLLYKTVSCSHYPLHILLTFCVCVCVCVYVCVRKGLVKSSEVPSTSTVGIIRGKYYMTIKVPRVMYTYIHICIHIYTYIGEGNSTPLQYSCLKNPWMEKPGRLQPMGLLRIGHDWATSLSLFTFMHWRKKWQPTPVFLPGESQEWGSLVGCCLWGHTELDTTEAT